MCPLYQLVLVLWDRESNGTVHTGHVLAQFLIVALFDVFHLVSEVGYSYLIFPTRNMVYKETKSIFYIHTYSIYHI